MKVTAKKLVTLGLTALMVLGTFTTAFAADPALTIYGQKPVKSGEMTDNNGNVFLTSYIVIIPETEVLDTSNITVANGWVAPRTPGWFTETTLNLGNYSANEGDFLSISCDNFETSERYMFQYLPTGVSVESLGEDAKYVIYPNGSTQTAQPTQTTSSWASDSKGWWIQNSDGSYLTNAWYQSPTSGLWYYMGADGYMLTNTTTPDGCVVNADGVWVQ